MYLSYRYLQTVSNTSSIRIARKAAPQQANRNQRRLSLVGPFPQRVVKAVVATMVTTRKVAATVTMSGENIGK